MKKIQKRYQYWGFKDGKAQKLWTKWFDFNGEEDPIQLKSHKGNHLLNEFRTVEK